MRTLGAGAGLMDQDTQKQLILIQHVNNNGDDLVEYINLWRQLQQFPLPEIDGGIVNQKQFEELEHLLESMIAQLEGWAQASGIIRSFSGAGLSPWFLAFFMTMRALGGQSAILVPIVSWEEEGRIRRIAVV